MQWNLIWILSLFLFGHEQAWSQAGSCADDEMICSPMGLEAQTPTTWSKNYLSDLKCHSKSLGELKYVSLSPHNNISQLEFTLRVIDLNIKKENEGGIFRRESYMSFTKKFENQIQLSSLMADSINSFREYSGLMSYVSVNPRYDRTLPEPRLEAGLGREK